MPSAPGPPGSWTAASNPHLSRVDRNLGPLLSGLGCELMWATAWMQEANEVIAPLLGLPPLPVADLPAYSGDRGADSLQWKTRALVRTAAGRPFVWVDDVIGQVDRGWVEADHPAPALLHQVEPSVGLTVPDVAVISAWLRELPAAG